MTHNTTDDDIYYVYDNEPDFKVLAKYNKEFNPLSRLKVTEGIYTKFFVSTNNIRICYKHYPDY